MTNWLIGFWKCGKSGIQTFPSWLVIFHLLWSAQPGSCGFGLGLELEIGTRLMLSSHLPRTPYEKFVYDFPCNCLGIVGGYGLRHMCSHYLRASYNFFYGASGATWGKSVQRLCRNCMEIVQCQCSCRAVSASSARKSYRARGGIGLRTVPVQGLCNATYDMSTGYKLTIFSSL